MIGLKQKVVFETTIIENKEIYIRENTLQEKGIEGDSWSMRVLQGLLQGRVRQVLVVVYTKANRFAQQRTVAILHSAKLCRTAVEQKRAVASYATLGIRVCFFCRRMPLNQSKALSRE